MSNKGACRTAPATQGLLKKKRKITEALFNENDYIDIPIYV